MVTFSVKELMTLKNKNNISSSRMRSVKFTRYEGVDDGMEIEVRQTFI